MTNSSLDVIADVVTHHQRLNPPGGECLCGHEVPLGASFSYHVADAILAAQSLVTSSSEQTTALIAEARAYGDAEEGANIESPSIFHRLADALEAATKEPSEWQWAYFQNGEHYVGPFNTEPKAVPDYEVHRRPVGAWEPVGGTE